MNDDVGRSSPSSMEASIENEVVVGGKTPLKSIVWNRFDRTKINQSKHDIHCL